MSLLAVLRRAISVLEGDRRYRQLVLDLYRELEALELREEVRRREEAIRPAEEGERFLWTPDGCRRPVELVVRAKSNGDEGRWYCIACGEAFEHQLGKNLHCQRERAKERQIVHEMGDTGAAHVLAWRNWCSGYVEVP